MFFHLYKEYREDILLTIMECYKSDDNRLVKVGGYSLVEMYILNNEFEGILNDISIMSKEQMEAIIEMLVVYFNISGYYEHSKQILERFLNTKNDIELPCSRLFYDKKIDLNRDRGFVKKMMSSLVCRRTLYQFVRYLEKEGIELLQYSDVIIDMCNNLFDILKDRTDKIWGVKINFLS